LNAPARDLANSFNLLKVGFTLQICIHQAFDLSILMKPARDMQREKF
jgi:hypothetical protein